MRNYITSGWCFQIHLPTATVVTVKPHNYYDFLDVHIRFSVLDNNNVEGKEFMSFKNLF